MPPKKPVEKEVPKEVPLLKTFPEWHVAFAEGFDWESCVPSRPSFTVDSLLQSDAFVSSALRSEMELSPAEWSVQNLPMTDLVNRLYGNEDFLKVLLSSAAPQDALGPINNARMAAQRRASRKTPSLSAVVFADKRSYSSSDSIDVILDRRAVPSSFFHGGIQPGYQPSSVNVVLRTLVTFIDSWRSSIGRGDYLWEAVRKLPSGNFAVRLFFRGAWRCVVVDDSFPTLVLGDRHVSLFHTYFSFFNDQVEAEFWPAILLKALFAVASQAVAQLSDERFVLSCLLGTFISSHSSTTLEAFNFLTANVISPSAPPMCLLSTEGADAALLAAAGLPAGRYLLLDTKQHKQQRWLRIARVDCRWGGEGSYENADLWLAPFESEFGFARQDRMVGVNDTLRDAWLPYSVDVALKYFTHMWILHPQTSLVADQAPLSRRGDFPCWTLHSTLHLEENKVPNPFFALVDVPGTAACQLGVVIARGSDQADCDTDRVRFEAVELDYEEGPSFEKCLLAAGLPSDMSSENEISCFFVSPGKHLLRCSHSARGPASVMFLRRSSDLPVSIEFSSAEDGLKKRDLTVVRDIGEANVASSSEPAVSDRVYTVVRYKVSFSEATKVHIAWIPTNVAESQVCERLLRFCILTFTDLETGSTCTQALAPSLSAVGSKNSAGFMVSLHVICPREHPEAGSVISLLSSQSLQYSTTFTSSRAFASPPAKIANAKNEVISTHYVPNMDSELFSYILQPSAEGVYDVSISVDSHGKDATILYEVIFDKSSVVASRTVKGCGPVVFSSIALPPGGGPVPAAKDKKAASAVPPVEIRATMLRMPLNLPHRRRDVAGAADNIHFVLAVVSTSASWTITRNSTRDDAMRAIQDTWGADAAPPPTDPKKKGPAGPTPKELVAARAEKAMAVRKQLLDSSQPDAVVSKSSYLQIARPLVGQDTLLSAEVIDGQLKSHCEARKCLLDETTGLPLKYTAARDSFAKQVVEQVAAETPQSKHTFIKLLQDRLAEERTYAKSELQRIHDQSAALKVVEEAGQGSVVS